LRCFCWQVRKLFHCMAEQKTVLLFAIPKLFAPWLNNTVLCLAVP
jgi:hypothetical protein